ncbi:MAG: DNA ligase (ATP) [Peltula sp. TS41687]|nr:MAG: DNA ligase (ATP) [Peltula sp. TS41687]
MTDSSKPEKKSKAELEETIKANGGSIFQTHTAAEKMICIADRRTVKVASLQKLRQDLIKPCWIFDCLRQYNIDKDRPRFLLPLEPKHLLFAPEESQKSAAQNVDEYGDSYARDVSIEELKQIMESMPMPTKSKHNEITMSALKEEVRTHNSHKELPGWLFIDTVVYLDQDHFPPKPEGGDLNMALQLINNTLLFGGAKIAETCMDETITHVIVVVLLPNTDERTKKLEKSIMKQTREKFSGRNPSPRIVTQRWVQESWEERTLLGEEREFFSFYTTAPT